MADMDIEMDIDVGLADDGYEAEEIEVLPAVATRLKQDSYNQAGPNDASEPDSLEPVAEKVYLRGLDNLTTKDVEAFASEYYPATSPSRVEWIDDTSANLVYETPENAKEALLAFTSLEIADLSQVPILRTMPAKSFPLHPQTYLEVRIAVVGDRKQPRAREKSRFYLMNPEYDPAERRKRSGYRGGNKYRDREEGGYRSQRYDDRENRKRQNENEEAGFDAGMYDDDESARASRAGRKTRHDSASSGSDIRERGGRRVRFRGAAGKELFPERSDRRSGRLRDRSASPMRDMDANQDLDGRRGDRAATANRLKAQKIKAQLQEATVTKELFPHKLGVNHRRSGAFDAADATADLFNRQMTVPFTDGSGDKRQTSGLSPVDRITIRGVAKTSATHDFSIRGAAQENAVKELFPGNNAGKELFTTRLEGRGGRRQKAEDLFY